MVFTAPLIPALAIAGQVDASPTPVFLLPNTLVAERPSACNDINSCRTLWGIIYSCIITIFTCTYVSFHPDVPDRTHTMWRIRATHICSVLLGFLLPEFMIAKAVVQWRWARKSEPGFQGMLCQ